MKTLKLLTKGQVLLFLSNFDPRSYYFDMRLVRELNKLLDWEISGRGSCDFANSLLSIASNLAPIYWCKDNTCRRGYATNVIHVVSRLKKAKQYPRFAPYIELPSWAYWNIQDIGKLDSKKLEPFSGRSHEN